MLGVQLHCLAYRYPVVPGEGNGTPLQYSCLENPRDGGAWWAAVHEVSTSWTWPSNFPFTFHFHVLEKEMATHSSVLAWRIPGMGETGGLPSMGSHRVGHDWSDLGAAASSCPSTICWKHYVFSHLIGLPPLLKISCQDLPGGTVDKNPPANVGDMCSIPDPGRSYVPQSSEARTPQLLRPHVAAVEACEPRACAPQQEATAMKDPHITMNSRPHSP